MRDNTIQAGSVETHYWEVTPEHPEATVVLVHDGAFGSDAYTSWHEIMARLGGRYRVLAPDLLGFGDTDKVVYTDRSPYAFRTAHLAAFCAALDINGAHFVGHSFGGSLVLRALAASTLPVLSATSISGSGGPWRVKEAVAELGRFDGTEQDLRRLTALMVDDYPGLDEVLKLRYANTLKPGHVEAVLAGKLKHPTRTPQPAPDSWPEALKSVSVPVLVIAGDRDPLMAAGWTEHLAGLSPAITVHRLDAKHAPNMDQPDTVAALLLSHLARTREPSARS
ncbi:alpha/beta fold hydrolase [Amycolatopsis sp. GM8]|uniref:alpha/beta fold hydrolase n=1 Tax=Amycolatopsis sp. GM8 TaxID=2896530 RepID=UPI001F34CC72|nr:alpha/beta hydrolase [Amycolatopsis sp. GM8]